MSHLVIQAVTYWFLVTGVNGGAPQAYGPYPSETVCKIAGHSRFYKDRRFMDAAQLSDDDKRIADEKARSDAKEAKRQARIAAFMKTHPNGGTLKADPSEVCEGDIVVDKNGRQTTWQGCLTISDPSWVEPITGCLRVDTVE